MKRVLLIIQTLLIGAIVILTSFKKNKGSAFFVYYTIVGVCHTLDMGDAGLNFTTGGSGSQAVLVTAATGTRLKLWGSCVYGGASNPVHFNP